jgi:hypothetical protein
MRFQRVRRGRHACAEEETMLKKSVLVALAVAGLAAAPLAASAQRYPNDSYPNGGAYPQDNRGSDRRDRDDRGNYNRNGYRTSTLSGRVTAFSPYNLDISNGPHIRLHNGTVINPTGAALNAGERVTVYGHPNGDGTFEADRIDVTNFNNGYRDRNWRR